MMFSAGMGIGLMFYGVAEPLAHFLTATGHRRPGSPEAFDIAMATTLVLDPAPVGDLRGGRPGHRLRNLPAGRPQLLSSAFIPLFGRKRAEGGSAAPWTSWRSSRRCSGRPRRSAWARLQIGGGLIAGGFMGAVSTTLLVTIIIVLTICFILSAVSGVSKGVQWLSNINMVLAKASWPWSCSSADRRC